MKSPVGTDIFLPEDGMVICTDRAIVRVKDKECLNCGFAGGAAASRYLITLLDKSHDVKSDSVRNINMKRK